MPWKGEKDPYKIWLSEIILQQTRVQQGLAYYNKFVHSYPNIKSLAAAADEDVYKLWEGLGYYSRCKNMLQTARYVADTLGGVFPQSYDEIIKLKGIGGYTAAAIASFAYNLPYAVVDGNVSRVLSRYFGSFTPIDTTIGKQELTRLAGELLCKADPASYNQAVMDFGATVCTPQKPHCEVCVLNDQCRAYKKDLVDVLPVKEKKLIKKNRYFNYFVVRNATEVLLRRRPAKDIWENLFEFYLVEDELLLAADDGSLLNFVQQHFGVMQFRISNVSRVYSQALTHQNIKTRFVTLRFDELPKLPVDYKRVPVSDLSLYAFPQTLNRFLQEDGIQNL